MTFDIVKNALLIVTQRVYRYTAIATPIFPYIVWADDGESDSLYGDGVMINQVLSGSVDLFSKTPDDPMATQIQSSLNNAGICFKLNDVSFNKDTKIIHYEWNFEIETEV